MNHLSLFTGIGGIDLAAEWVGFTTVGQCEFADYPTKILEKHWPSVPRWRDIRDVTKESFTEKTRLRTIELISGGFPCQPFSIAGKRKGKDDDRYLWPEMLRVISELQPSWVIGENVANILNMGVESCISDLENIGYEVQIFVIPACAVQANHRRNRVFIIANSKSKRRLCVGKDREKRYADINFKIGQEIRGYTLDLLSDVSEFFDNPVCGIRRNDDGLSEGVDRLKCLGNAVVPQQVYPILKAIYEIERR
jgi:DNA (cytosine-5)-methyltransferase 1